MILLATDLAFFTTLIACGIYVAAARGDPVSRARWRVVLGSPVGGGAALVLALYVVTACLDSVHLDTPGGVRSLLDRALHPLRTQVETTYSAPFAAYGHARETVQLADGRMVQEYPRLRFGARHLADPERERTPDIIHRAFVGGGVGLAVFGVLLLTINAVRGRPIRQAAAQLRERPWAGHGWLLAALCAGVGAVAALAPHYHVLGTDKVGNDVLLLTLKSVRTGLVIGVVSSAIALPIGVALGIAAGYFGSWVDDVVQYLYTTLSSVPGVLLIAAAALSFDLLLQQTTGAFASLEMRADLKLLSLCLVLGLTGWTGLCRLVRAETLKLRAIEYVSAARALGTPVRRILSWHLVPNTFHLVIITTVLDFSGLVLAEAVLTYIDIGVDPSMESWGNMINGARLELAREPVVWWSLAAAFAGMFVLVLAANLFADAVRDAFDPHLREVPPTNRREVPDVAA
ncbi:MAG: ABC transporter permease [Gammaproteobacteria bacterium]